jgi:hypothetical protein
VAVSTQAPLGVFAGVFAGVTGFGVFGEASAGDGGLAGSGDGGFASGVPLITSGTSGRAGVAALDLGVAPKPGVPKPGVFAPGVFFADLMDFADFGVFAGLFAGVGAFTGVGDLAMVFATDFGVFFTDFGVLAVTGLFGTSTIIGIATGEDIGL